MENARFSCQLLLTMASKTGVATVTQLAEFDEVIDVRSPAEFAEDHLPRAINCPALDNEQRARVGTLYKQVSPFAARRVGGALVARNIADHLLAHFQQKEKSWRPLIYCWRGGQRSGAFVTIFRQIGWDAHQLEGGYKAYRRWVVAELGTLPQRFRYRVLCGATGSGKSRLLEALAERGAQVLHLEHLAAHRGSVLGAMPDQPQPGQKQFESHLLTALSVLDPDRPVFVEAESRKIGKLQLPEALLMSMRASPCLEVHASTAARVDFLLRDYSHFLGTPAQLKERLGFLHALQSRETLARWEGYIDSTDWPSLVEELLRTHYDPLYQRSQGKNYPAFNEAAPLTTDDLSPASIGGMADQIIAAGLGDH